MATTTDFNLRALVREVLDASTLTDPGLVAAEVDRRINSRECRTALRQALRTFVRQVMTESFRAERVTAISQGAGTIAAPQSWKVREVAAYKRWLRSPVQGATGWKALGDCTVADLDFIAGYRDRKAAENKAKAREVRELKRLMVEQGAEQVRDLTAETLARILGRAA